MTDHAGAGLVAALANIPKINRSPRVNALFARIEALTAEVERLQQRDEIAEMELAEMLARVAAAESRIATIEAETIARCERVARGFTSHEDNPIATAIRNQGRT